MGAGACRFFYRNSYQWLRWTGPARRGTATARFSVEVDTSSGGGLKDTVGVVKMLKSMGVSLGGQAWSRVAATT